MEIRQRHSIRDLEVYQADSEKNHLLEKWARKPGNHHDERLFLEVSLEQPIEEITDTLESVIDRCEQYGQGLIDLLDYIQNETLCSSYAEVKKVIEKFRIALTKESPHVILDFPQLQAEFKCLFFYLRGSNWEYQRLYADVIKLSQSDNLESTPIAYARLIRGITHSEMEKAKTILALKITEKADFQTQFKR